MTEFSTTDPILCPIAPEIAERLRQPGGMTVTGTVRLSLGDDNVITVTVHDDRWGAVAAQCAEARALLDAWCHAAQDGEPLEPLRAQTLAWMEGR